MILEVNAGTEHRPFCTMVLVMRTAFREKESEKRMCCHDGSARPGMLARRSQNVSGPERGLPSTHWERGTSSEMFDGRKHDALSQKSTKRNV